MYAHKIKQDDSLAFFGGTPVRSKPFPAHNTIGDEEKKAVCKVMDSGVLSKYLGCWHEDFMGGPEVKALEEEWADFFGTGHAIAVNSCTSGLFCAVGAIGTAPGDEIIVRQGTYSGGVTVRTSGTSGQRITIRAESGVIFNGNIRFEASYITFDGFEITDSIKGESIITKSMSLSSNLNNLWNCFAKI